MSNRRFNARKLCGRAAAIVNISLLTAFAADCFAAPLTPLAAQAVDPLAIQNYAAETFEALASRCAGNVHVRTLSAIVMQESRGNPFAIGINRAKQLDRQPRNEQEAISTARSLLAKGYNFDAGLGQINSANFPSLGLTPSNLFDPCVNLRSAATVLTACYAKASKSFGPGQSGLHGALSCYNTGSLTRGFRNGYVGKVVSKVAQQVPALAPPSQRREVSRPAPQVEAQGEPSTFPPSPEIAPTPPSNHGMGDAFSKGHDDAFTAAASSEERRSQPDPDQNPVILTAVEQDS